MPRKLTTEEFIERAKTIHGDLYDYSKVVYKASHTHVIIICKRCGLEFLQTPNAHLYGNNLKGHGCPFCNHTRRSNKEEFIRRAKEIYGDKYDYSEVVYINSRTKVKIICPEHGPFYKTPKSHLNGRQGCPYCKETKGELKIRTWLENQKILYKKYQEYEGLIYKRSMNTDFYIESCNLAIEYQGGQHYGIVCFKGMSQKQAEENFKEQQIKDKIKEKYFKNSDIDLLCIHYKDYKKVEGILEKVIIEKDFEYLKTTNSCIF